VKDHWDVGLVAALEQAKALGFRVLSTRAHRGVRVGVLIAGRIVGTGLARRIPDLPPPQRLAVDRVLLRVSADGPETDQAARWRLRFYPVVDASPKTPLCWWRSMICSGSTCKRTNRVVGRTATRRSSGRACDCAHWPGYRGAASALEFFEPDKLRRVRVNPLTVGALHNVLLERLGRSFSRPKMVQIMKFRG